MIVVDGIEKLLKKQYDAHAHALAQAKMKVPMHLPREFMRELIGQVSPYALSKIYDQYLLVIRAKKKPEEHALKPCQRIFATTMGLPCAHMIVAALNTEEKKLLLEDVHPHWRFKKPDSCLLTPTRDFVSDPPPNPPPVASESDLSSLPSSSSDESLPDAGNLSSSSEDELLSDADDLIRGRIESPLVSEMEEGSGLEDLRDIAEPNVAKAKGRPSGSLNKKGLMTQVDKKAARSTKRNPSGFEHVERELATRAKRTKKTTDQARNDRGGRRGRDEASKAKGGASTRARGGASSTRGRGGASTRGRSTRGRGAVAASATTSMITRSGANASMPMELSSNTESSDAEVNDEGDGFNNLPESSSDEDFHASKQGDEEAEDEWMD